MFVLLGDHGPLFSKKSKCRDFDEKINQTPLLHSDKFSKVKYLNSANYIVRGVHMPSDSKKKWRILLGFQEKKWQIPRDSEEKKWQTPKKLAPLFH